MIKKFKLEYGKIQQIEVVRETDEFVIHLPSLAEVKRGKTDGYSSIKKGKITQYFDTWDEANEFRIMRCANKIDSLKRQLEEESANLEQYTKDSWGTM